MSQQQQCHKQIVLPPLCMPPQSFPQPCCPPCFYPPPCFPCCPPNPCCPQPCCPPPCAPAPCCPPPCCQAPCVPCCPKVPCAPCCPPCCPPKCGPCPPKSRCNCCGGRSTVICVPRGAPPPCPPQCFPCPCPCPCPCRPQCCGDSSGGNGGGSGGDKPASFNNCNFYCSELPKSFGGGNGAGPDDDCGGGLQQPECCPEGEGFDDCDDGPYNRAAGDDQLAPVPRGTPRRYHSPVTRSRSTRNNNNNNDRDWWRDYKPNKQRRGKGGKGGRAPFRGGGKKRQNVNENEDDPYGEDDEEEGSQYSGNDNNDEKDDHQCYPQRMPPPPRPPRRLLEKNNTKNNCQNNDHENGYLEEESLRLAESVPYCENRSMMMEQQPSFFTCCQTTATTNSFRGSANPSLIVKNRESILTTTGGQGKGQKDGARVNAQTNDDCSTDKTIKHCVDTWSGLKTCPPFRKTVQVPRTTTNGTSNNLSKPASDDKNETDCEMSLMSSDKAATAPAVAQTVGITKKNPVTNNAVTVTTTTTAGGQNAAVRSVPNKNKGKVLNVSGMEVQSPAREKNTKFSTNPTTTGKVESGGKNGRRKFKSPVRNKIIRQEDPNPNAFRRRPGDGQMMRGQKNEIQVDYNNNNVNRDCKDREMDKLLWSLIPSAALANNRKNFGKVEEKSPLSTLNIFGPPICPDNASSDLISAPPTQPYTKSVDDNCGLIQIQSGPIMAKMDNEFSELVKNHQRERRRARSCDGLDHTTATKTQGGGDDRDGGKGWRAAATALTPCGGECGQILSINDNHHTDQVEDSAIIELCQKHLIVDTTHHQNQQEKEKRQSSIVRDTLASILKKKPPLLRYGKGIVVDQVKFAPQDFCVMTCFVGRGGGVKTGQTSCGYRRHDSCPPPVIIIPPPSFSPAQWTNFQFNSTPSSHLTGCSPCGVTCPCQCPCSNGMTTSKMTTKKNTLPEPKSRPCSRSRSRSRSRNRSPSPCFLPPNFCPTFPSCCDQCPILYGLNNCQDFVGRPGPGSPFTPYRSTSPCPAAHHCRRPFSGQEGGSLGIFGGSKVTTTTPSSGVRPATAPHGSQAGFEKEEKKTPPPRPPPPVPPRRPLQPPLSRKISSPKSTEQSAPVSAKNSKSGVPIRKLFQTQMNQFSHSSSPRVERTTILCQRLKLASQPTTLGTHATSTVVHDCHRPNVKFCPHCVPLHLPHVQ